MKVLKVIAQILLFIVLFLFSVGYFATTFVERTVLSNSYYRRLLVDKNVVADIHKNLDDILADIMMDDMLDETDREDFTPATEDTSPYSDETDMEEVKKYINLLSNAVLHALDAEWIEDTALMVIDELLSYAKSPDEKPDIVVDLTERKELLKEYLAEEFRSLSPEELEDMEINPDEIDEYAENFVAEMDLPDKLDLNEMIDDSDVFERIEPILSRIRIIRIISFIVPYVFFALVFLCFFFLTSLTGAFKRFGWGILVPGTLVAIAIITARAVVLRILSIESDSIPVDFEIIRTAVGFTANRIILVPAIFALLGLAFIIGGTIAGRIKKNKSESQNITPAPMPPPNAPQ